MARLNPAARRAAIIDATLAVMQRKGIAATTVRDVAQEMGTSPGLVHHYFTSMDELIASDVIAGLPVESPDRSESHATSGSSRVRGPG
jgi:TetR/AcrR family transcriptional repressor of bet genes